MWGYARGCGMFGWERLQEGGPVLLVILATSLVGVGAIVYCLLALRRRVVLSAPLVEVARTLRSEGGAARAEETCRAEGGPFAEILLTVIATRRAGYEEAESLVESAGRRAVHELSRGVLVLETIAAVSPLLGLLGTVIGMYRVFQEIAHVGAREVVRLSSGISEALLTTIFGLLVAIPAYIAFTAFSRRVEDLVLEMERMAVPLMARLRGGEASAAPDPDGRGRE